MGNDISKFGQHREELRGENAQNDDSKRLHDLPGRDEAQQELVRRAVEAKRKEKAEKKSGAKGGAQEFLKTHFKRPPLKSKGGGGGFYGGGKTTKMKSAAARKSTPRATTSKLKSDESGFKDKDANSIISGNKLGRDRSQSINGSHKSSTLENGAAKSSKKERLDQKVNDWLNNENNLWTFHDVPADVLMSRNQAAGGDEAPVPPVYAFRQDPTHMPFHLPYFHHPHVYSNDVSATLPRSHSIGASNEQHHRQQQPVYAAYQPFMYHPYFTPYIPQFYHNQSPHHYPPVYHNTSQLIPFLSPQLARGSRQQAGGESRSKSQNNLADSGNGRGGNSADISAHSDTALPNQQGRKTKLMSAGAISDDLVSTHRFVGSTFDSIDCIHQQSSRSLHHHSITTYHDSSLTNSTTCNDVIFDDVRHDNSSSISTGNNPPMYRKEESGEESPMYSLSLQYTAASTEGKAPPTEQPMMKLRESQSIVATSFQTSSGKFFCLTRSKSSSANPAASEVNRAASPNKNEDEGDAREEINDKQDKSDDDSSLASTLESNDDKTSTQQTSEENDDTKVASDDEVEEYEEKSRSSSEEEEEEEEAVIEHVTKIQSPPIPRPRSSLSIPSSSTLPALVEDNSDENDVNTTHTTAEQIEEDSVDTDSTEMEKQNDEDDEDVRQEINEMESELMKKKKKFMSLSSTATSDHGVGMNQRHTLHKQLSETKREQSEDLLKRVNHILNGKSEFVAVSESSGGSEASWMMRNSTTTKQQQSMKLQPATNESIQMRNATNHHHQLQRLSAAEMDNDFDVTSPTYRSTFNYKLNSPTKELQTVVEAKVELKPTSPPEVKDFLGGQRRDTGSVVRDSPFIRRQVAAPPVEAAGKSETLEERAARILGRSTRSHHASINYQKKLDEANTSNSSSSSSGVSGELQSYNAPLRTSTEYKLPNDVLRRDHVVKSPTHSAPGRESIMASFAMTDQLYERSPTTTTTTTTTNGSVRFDGGSDDDSVGDQLQKKFSNLMLGSPTQRNNGVERRGLSSYKDQLNAVADAVGFNSSHRVRQFQQTTTSTVVHSSRKLELSNHEVRNHEVNAQMGSTSSSSMSSNSDSNQQSRMNSSQNHHHQTQMVRQKQVMADPSSTSRGQQQNESQVREVMESLGLNPDESWMVSL